MTQVNDYKIRLNTLVLFFIILVYPIFIRDEFFLIKAQHVLNISFIALSFAVFYIYGIRFNKNIVALIPFVLWMIVVLIFGVFGNFQETNSQLNVEPFFAINTDGDLADNYFNIGNFSINFMYMTRMIIFIPLSMMVGSSIKLVNKEYIRKLIWLFLLISILSLFYDYVLAESLTRLSGIYRNPQDMSAILLFNAVLFFSLSPRKKECILFILCTFIGIFLTGTRSSLIVFFFLIALRKHPQKFLWIALVVSIIVSYIFPIYMDKILSFEITSMSSSLARFKLWGDYLWPNINKNLFFGAGTIPIVTESLVLFLLYVYGLIGTVLFLMFVIYQCYFSGKRNKVLTVALSVVIFQSVYFMGLLSLDNIVVTFFWVGYLAQSEA